MAKTKSVSDMKSFEARLARLEELSEKIKEADLALEEAVACFEEGIKLARGLEKDLSKIEGKIEILLNNPLKAEEPPVLELFPELADSQAPQAAD